MSQPLPASSPSQPTTKPSRRIGRRLLILVALEVILLFFNTGTLLLGLIQNQSYADIQNQVGVIRAVSITISLLALASFILPVVIGMLSPSWRAAVALPILAVCLALFLTIAVSLFYTPTFLRSLPYSSFPILGTGFSPLTNYWLNVTLIAVLLLAFLLFGLLGWIGSAARSAFTSDD